MFQPSRYEVTGTQPVLDHEPGTYFEADIPPVQEARLLASGALRLVPVESPEFPPPLDSEPPTTPTSTSEESVNG